MERFTFSSLQGRLFKLVLITIVPLLGLLLYSGLEDYQKSRSQAFREALNLARNVSQIQDNIMDDARQRLGIISQMLQMNQLDPSVASAIFLNLLQNQPVHTGFLLTKPNGETITGAPILTQPSNIAGYPYYQRLIETGDFVIGEYKIGIASGKAIVPLAYPILNKTGRVEAILATGLDLDWLNDYLSKIKLPQGTQLNVIDSQGTVLLRYPSPKGFVGKSMPESIVKAILEKKEGVKEETGLDKVTRLYGFTSFGQPYGSVYVSVGIPKEVAFAEVNRRMFRNLALLAIVALVAFAAAWSGADFFFIRSAKRLLRITRLLANGDLTSRVGAPYGRGEIAQLAYSFDQMAEALEMRDKALRESEERYHSLFEQCRDAIYIVTKEGIMIDVNKRSSEIYGYPREELIGRNAIIVYADPGDRAKMLQELDKKGFIVDYYLKGRKKDGTIMDTLLTSTVRYGPDGSIVGYQGIVRDVTERNRMEEALRKSEARLQLQFKRMPIGLIVWDPQATVLSWNPMAERIFGFTASEVIGKRPYKSLIPSNAKDQVNTVWQRLMEGDDTAHSVNKNLTKDGKVIICDWTNTPLKEADGTVLGVLSMFQDITDQKKTEERIRRESARTEALLHVAARINSQLNLQEVLKSICEEAALTLKVPVAMVSLYEETKEIVQTVADFGLPPELRSQLLPIPRETFDRITKKYGSAAFITDIQDAPGMINAALYTRENVRTYGFAGMKREGKLIGALSVMIFGSVRHFCDDELSLLKGLGDQAALAVANAQLFEQVSAGHEQLQILSRRLVEVQETERRHIARELHDEIAQTLTGLKLYIETSMRLSGDKAKDCLVEAQRLSSDLLGKIDEMSLNLRPSMLDDLGLLPALLWHFQRYTNQTKVNVNFNHHGLKERRFTPDVETAAYRIIQESLTNIARHASVGEAGVSLRICQNSLIVEIIDQGLGFDPRKIKAACGLSGMQERALSLGGCLKIESSPDKGTRLTANLPLNNTSETRKKKRTY